MARGPPSAKGMLTLLLCVNIFGGLLLVLTKRRPRQGDPPAVSLANRDLIATKKGMNLQGAWGIVQHIQGRFADGPAAVNPMLLEAEVKHAQARSGQESTDSDAEPGEEDVEAVESGAGEEDASLASSSVPEAADAKPHHEQRAHTPKRSSSQGTKKKQSSMIQAAMKQKDKYEAFKQSVRDRANKMKEVKKMDTTSKIAAARGRPQNVQQARLPQQVLINKMQERSALEGITVKPAHWLATAESSLKPKDTYACHAQPPLQESADRPHRRALPPPIDEELACQKDVVHIAITINRDFAQGALALMYSVLWNAACPARVVFHVCHLKDFDLRTVFQFFPSANYRSYVVDGTLMTGTIRGMVYRGKDLENPLNYVRINLPYMLPTCVEKFIYVDTDTLMLGRIEDLFATPLGKHVIGSPEFCEYKFQDYFTADFWKNHTLSAKFEKSKKACYFNPGVMVVNPAAWRKAKATEELLRWMKVQKASSVPLYTLGSLPPFLLVFAGQVASIGKAWNEHDLGCNCGVIPVPSKARLLHWSCGDKPWRRIKSGAPCVIDSYYWRPYDLLGGVQDRNWCDDGDLPARVASLPVLHASEGVEQDMGPAFFEQLYIPSKPRHCPAPVRVPGLQAGRDGA
eukprot:jgi/Tetstr1/462742/TSEL_000702.t1